MEVITTGTGSPIPSPDRAGPSTLVRTPAGPFLVDAGRGVIMRLAAAGVMPVNLRALLLTHLHSDHITDLNDLITTRWIMTTEPDPLVVYGPEGTQEVVDHILAMLSPDIGYRLAHHDDLDWPPPVEVHEIAAAPDQPVFDADGAVITAQPTDHRPVAPTIGFRVEADGKAIALAGDTIPCDGLDTLVRGADVYVQTVVRDDFVKMVPNQRLQDILDYHSTVLQSGEVAAKGGVGTLVLTHLVPPPPPEQEDEWRSMAAAAFEGTIVVARDLTEVSC